MLDSGLGKGNKTVNSKPAPDGTNKLAEAEWVLGPRASGEPPRQNRLIHTPPIACMLDAQGQLAYRRDVPGRHDLLQYPTKGALCLLLGPWGHRASVNALVDRESRGRCSGVENAGRSSAPERLPQWEECNRGDCIRASRALKILGVS